MMTSICTERILVSCVSNLIMFLEGVENRVILTSALGSPAEATTEEDDPLDILEERYVDVWFRVHVQTNTVGVFLWMVYSC